MFKKFVSVLAALMIAVLTLVPAIGACAADVNNDTAAVQTASVNMYVSSANGKGVNLRTQPSTNAKLIMTLGEGRPVTVYESDGSGWSRISVMVNGVQTCGYAMTKYLSKTDPSRLAQSFRPVSTFTVKVRTASKNGVVSLWDTTAKLSVDKIRDLTRTEVLTVIEESRAWYIVSDQFGNLGYVAKAYVTKA